MGSSQHQPAWRFSHDLLDLVVPDGGVAALLAAYFDASQMDSGVFSVGGFAFGRDRAKKACRDWHKLWGNTICHMADLNSRKPGTMFEGWTGPQAGARLEDSVQIINRYASYAVCVSCDLPEAERLAPESAAKGSEMYLGGFRHAYGTCCHLAMATLGELIRSNNGIPAIAYFFESGDRYQAQSQQFISRVTIDPLLKAMYCHNSHTVADKSDARLLETADILAWEWARHRERARCNQPTRPSLIAMLDPTSSGHMGEADFASSTRMAMHISGAPLERYFNKVKQYVLS